MPDNYEYNGLKFVFQLPALLCVIYYNLSRDSFVIYFLLGVNSSIFRQGSGVDYNNVLYKLKYYI